MQQVLASQASYWLTVFTLSPNNTHSRAVYALLIATATVAATRELVSVFSPLSISCTALKKTLQCQAIRPTIKTTQYLNQTKYLVNQIQTRLKLS